MGITHLWDTNTVIYYLQQQFPPQAEKFIDQLLNDSFPVISTITEIELLCWTSPSPSDVTLLKNFVQDAFVIELEQSIKQKTADIRKTSKLKLPDAIIAATSVVYNLTLITRNKKDFKNISELKMISPWDL